MQPTQAVYQAAGVLGTVPLQMTGISMVSCGPGVSPASTQSPGVSPAYTPSPVYSTVSSARPVSNPSSPVPYAYAAAGHVQGAPMTTYQAPNQVQAPVPPKGPWVTQEAAVDPKARELWGKIATGGSASLDELRAASQRDPELAQFLSRCGVMNGAKPREGQQAGWMAAIAGLASAAGADACRDPVARAFEVMAEGKDSVDFGGFEAQHRLLATIDGLPATGAPRSSKRVFIISAGFGRLLRPLQSKMVEAAGFQIHWCTKPPNPETPNFPVGPYLQQIKAEIDEFKPDLIMSASKGGVYVVGLWEAGLWLGPSLMINAHPTCHRLPKGCPVIIAAGAADEHYPTTRAGVYQLQATGTRSHCFMYFAAGTGHRLPPGHTSRMGDRHNMDTLLSADCLPRLMDAVLCPEGPEVHMVRTFPDRLAPARLQAESSLRERLLQSWAGGGAAETQLAQVAPDSEEFREVAAVFCALPKEASAYRFAAQAQGPWEHVRVAGIQRVQLSAEEAASARARQEKLRASLEDQGVPFEAAAHSRFAFYHGCGAKAVGALQPTQQGPWGTGIYFARDAKYVADSGICRAGDGSKSVLLCLLDSGMPCVADCNSASGQLPRRRGSHHYDSSIDSLSNPELYIMPDAGAAHAAYVITFA